MTCHVSVFAIRKSSSMSSPFLAMANSATKSLRSASIKHKSCECDRYRVLTSFNDNFLHSGHYHLFHSQVWTQSSRQAIDGVVSLRSIASIGLLPILLRYCALMTKLLATTSLLEFYMLSANEISGYQKTRDYRLRAEISAVGTVMTWRE